MWAELMVILIGASCCFPQTLQVSVKISLQIDNGQFLPNSLILLFIFHLFRRYVVYGVETVSLNFPRAVRRV
jgi:hypothetical protein